MVEVPGALAVNRVARSDRYDVGGGRGYGDFAATNSHRAVSRKHAGNGRVLRYANRHVGKDVQGNGGRIFGSCIDNARASSVVGEYLKLPQHVVIDAEFVDAAAEEWIPPLRTAQPTVDVSNDRQSVPGVERCRFRLHCH